MSYTEQQFLEIVKPAVLADAQRSGILASLTAAQAMVESGNGNSLLTQKANNLFGIKGTYNGQYVWMATKEWNGTEYITVNAKWRKYPSWQESINDHSDFLLTNSRYRNVIGVTDYKTACTLIHQDGYATAPNYANTLISRIESHRLYEWDVVIKEVNYAAIVTASALNVRSGPGTNHPIVVSGGSKLILPKGMVVAICAECNGFGRLSDIQGWVSLTYLRK